MRTAVAELSRDPRQLPRADFHRQATTSLRTRRSAEALHHGLSSHCAELMKARGRQAPASVAHVIPDNDGGFGVQSDCTHPKWLTETSSKICY
jgi:hypothetical protein